MIKIDINLVFTIINLLVLYLLMKKFLFGPIINVMDQRKAMIDQQFAEAKERQDNAKELQEQYEGALRSAKEESYQIMEQARKEAKAQADHTVEETTAKVDAMLAKAQEDIRMERENAMRQMKGDVAELAMKAGVTARTIQNYELGTRKPGNMVIVQRIADALGTTTEQLLSSGETLVVAAHERGGARAAKDINELVSEVTGMFAGGKLSDDALDGAMRALNEAYWIAKDKNKKYGRKKKKDAEET